MQRLKDDYSNAETETLGDWSTMDGSELQELLFLVLEKLNLDAVRTNQTKHGAVEIRLQERGAKHG